MKKAFHTLNKNVSHNTLTYKKGQEITKEDEGFKDLVEAGHVDVHEFKGAGEESNPPHEGSDLDAINESKEKSAKSGKSGK